MAMSVALLCVDPTQSSETGAVRGLPLHNLPRESLCREVGIGQTGRGRALGGEGPLGTAAHGGRGFKERTRVSGERPIAATSFRRPSIWELPPPQARPLQR